VARKRTRRIKRITLKGAAPTNCRIVGFDPATFERIEILKATAWRCRHCELVFLGSAEDRAGFAHDCRIPGDLLIAIRGYVSENPSDI